MVYQSVHEWRERPCERLFVGDGTVFRREEAEGLYGPHKLLHAAVDVVLFRHAIEGAAGQIMTVRS